MLETLQVSFLAEPFRTGAHPLRGHIMARSTADHVLAVTKAALNFVPLVGGSVASLISDYVPTSTQRSLEQAARMLSEKIHDLEQRIDIEAVNKEDFAELFNGLLRVSGRTNREHKLRTAANLTANVLLRDADKAKSPFNELDHLMHCVDALSIGAITVLGAARRLQPQETALQRQRFAFRDLGLQLPNEDPELIRSLVSELQGWHLVHVLEGQITVADYSHVNIRVTPLGMRFVRRFIEGEM